MYDNKALCNYAISLVGKVSYVFGADDVEHGKADCSAFTQHVFAVFGQSIGRTTQAQYTTCNPIRSSEARAGDLIFFKNTYNSGYIDGVSHVGIYLGNNKFVHCSTSKGVTVTDLEGFYENHLLGFRRVNGISKEVEKVEYNMNEATEEKETLNNWLGDIIKVIIIILLLVVAMGYFGLSIGLNIQAGVLKKGGKL